MALLAKDVPLNVWSYCTYSQGAALTNGGMLWANFIE